MKPIHVYAVYSYFSGIRISYVHLHINTSQLSLWDYAEWQFSLPRLAQTPLKSQNLPTLFRGLPEILPTPKPEI